MTDARETIELAKKKTLLATRLYLKRDFKRAKEILDEVIAGDHGSPARYLRGRGYEDGLFPGGVDLDRAYEDFHSLRQESQVVGSLGILGCARVLYEKDALGNKAEILSLCEEAVQCDGNPKAMMLLGLMHERVIADIESAKKFYLAAYRRGLPWGLRFYARAQARSGRRLISLAAHIATSVTSPFLVLLNGVKSPLK